MPFLLLSTACHTTPCHTTVHKTFFYQPTHAVQLNHHPFQGVQQSPHQRASYFSHCLGRGRPSSHCGTCQSYFWLFSRISASSPHPFPLQPDSCLNFLLLLRHGWEPLAQDWGHPFLPAFCDCYPLTPPSYPSNLTEYRVGKWLITALTRFTVQGILWVLLQRSFIPLCFPKWLLSCSKVFPKYPVGPGKALPVDEGLSGVLFCFVPLGRCSVAKNVWWLQSYEEADNAMSWEHPRHDTKLEMKRKNEEKTRIHVHPFRVSCHDCQHHQARHLETSRSLMVSRQILDGADLDQICNTHPSHSTPLLLPLLPLVFAQTDVRTSKWVSLALKSFLSNLPPQSLQNANYNISLLEMLLWCLKLSQLRMDIAIPWVLFSRFTFLSSTHNLINQNRLGIRPGYTQFEKDFW